MSFSHNKSKLVFLLSRLNFFTLMTPSLHQFAMARLCKTPDSLNHRLKFRTCSKFSVVKTLDAGKCCVLLSNHLQKLSQRKENWSLLIYWKRWKSMWWKPFWKWWLNRYKPVLIFSLTLLCMMLKNGPTRFKNLALWTPQDFQSMFVQFSTLRSKRLTRTKNYLTDI